MFGPRPSALGVVFWIGATLAAEGVHVEPGLSVGQTLPRIEAASLTDRQVVLPKDASGKSTLLIFTFSRKAGDAAKAWGEAFARLEAPGRAGASYRILVLGSVPNAMRGMVLRGVAKGIPTPLHDTTLKLFEGEDFWKARLAVRSDEDPHLVILDGEGKIRWMHAGACDAAGERLLAAEWSKAAPAPQTTKP